MKSRLSLVLPLSLAVVLAAPAQQTPPAAAAAPAASAPAAGSLSGKSLKEKASYGIGVNIGRNMKQQPGLEIDLPSMILGLQDAVSGGAMKLNDREMEEALQAMGAEISKRAAAKQREVGEANKKEGEAFLAANKGKEGVQVRPSGLQYKVVKEGNGATPKATDTVKVHYRGTLLNGKEFDSSYKRNEPATFPVNRVIAGWTEALQLMKVGSKYQLWIPSDLAYKETGPGGPGSDIGPNAMLTFEVELLGIEAAAPAEKK